MCCLSTWQTMFESLSPSSHSPCNIYLGVSANGSLWSNEKYGPSCCAVFHAYHWWYLSYNTRSIWSFNYFREPVKQSFLHHQQHRTKAMVVMTLEEAFTTVKPPTSNLEVFGYYVRFYCFTSNYRWTLYLSHQKSFVMLLRSYEIQTHQGACGTPRRPQLNALVACTSYK